MVEYLDVVALLVGLLSTISGGIAWYRSVIRQQYAGERSSAHLQNSVAQLSAGVASLGDDIERLEDSLRDSILSLERAIGRVEAYISVRNTIPPPSSQ